MIDLVRFGTDYGGFYYPRDLPGLCKESIIYCVGVGEDISHDIGISGALKGADLYLFDPTPRAIAHVKKVQNVQETGVRPANNKREGGGDPTYWDRVLNTSAGPCGEIHFVPCAMDVENQERLFYPPKNTEFVSCRFWDQGAKGDPYTVQCKTLQSIMGENGHDRVDLLKLDIEGAEIDVLNALLDDTVPENLPVYLSVDFDSARVGINGGAKAARALLNRLSTHYDVLKDSNWDVSFVLRSTKK